MNSEEVYAGGRKALRFRAITVAILSIGGFGGGVWIMVVPWLLDAPAWITAIGAGMIGSGFLISMKANGLWQALRAGTSAINGEVERRTDEDSRGRYYHLVVAGMKFQISEELYGKVHDGDRVTVNFFETGDGWIDSVHRHPAIDVFNILAAIGHFLGAVAVLCAAHSERETET